MARQIFDFRGARLRTYSLAFFNVHLRDERNRGDRLHSAGNRSRHHKSARILNARRALQSFLRVTFFDCDFQVRRLGGDFPWRFGLHFEPA